ncbi:hypothetical protein BS47DRAFT_29976 [Hydnum rufescens UP504]|uniref:Enhancer of polycomb-like protein n=1 Tax=Hydnum rufescens UP504 TaxID=1448309 RepID=A0A9P6DYD5_9AGAM|nr:hypothetical protein BS47DRAFT_29976 [Hydnum rufescens UP504]
MGRLDKVVTTAGGLRTRNRVTNKTRLKVVDGDVDDAELVFLEEDSDKNKVLDTAGVEHEDAKEEHLVKVLAAAARRITSSRSTKVEDAAAASIPIPDATGIVEDYTQQYPPDVWTDPNTYIKSSDTVEESIEGVLLGSFTYDMDERDVEWLEKNNSIARGEGSSTSPVSGRTHPPSRNAKTRSKETTDRPSFVITETELELVMGLFEKFTDERCPYLHLDIKGLPPLSEYEPLFATPLQPSIFASFQVPSYCRDPSHLLRLARAIYPHWKERKIARQGHKIIPQLNYDESNDGDPYVCFRRRDVKSVRKTRRTDTTPADKVTKLRSELINAKDLASSVVSREVKKLELGKDARVVLEARLRLVEHKRKYPHFASPHDDALLVDPERTLAKRPKLGESGVSLKITRRSKEATELTSPAGSIEDPPNPHERAAFYQKEIERHCELKKNSSWEDYIDLQVSLPTGPTPNLLFRSLSAHPRTKDPPPRASDGYRVRSPFSIRIRTGRGGRQYVDRRVPVHRNPLGPPLPIPTYHTDMPNGFWTHQPKQWPFSHSVLDLDKDSIDDDGAESIHRLEERWRYDNESLDADEEQRVVIDDYEERYVRPRLETFQEDDFKVLSIDLKHVTQAESYASLRQAPGIRALGAARAQLMQARAQAQAQAQAQVQAQAPSQGQASDTAGAGGAPTSSNPPTLHPNAPSQPLTTVPPTPLTPSSQQPLGNATGAIQPQPPPQPPVQQYSSHAQTALLQAHAQRMSSRPMPISRPLNGVVGQAPPNGSVRLQPHQIPPSGQQQAPPNGAQQHPGSYNAAQAGGNLNGLEPSVAQLQAPASDGNSAPSHVNSPSRPKSQPQAPMAVPQMSNLNIPGFHGQLPFNYPNGVNGQVPPYTREQMVHHLATLKTNAQFGNAGLQQLQQQANGMRGMMPPPQQVGQNGQYHPGMPMPNGVPNGTPLGMQAANTPLKMPVTRHMQWARQHSEVGPASVVHGVNGGAAGAGGGSPVMHHMSPNASGRASPGRMSSGAIPGRNSPMNPHQQLQQQPIMDVHGVAQHRTTPSPLSMVSDVPLMQHPSPHLPVRSPANQHQLLGNAPA